MKPWQPHPDKAAARAHFNGTFRHRYRLRALDDEESILEPDEWAELIGLSDAGCAVLARHVAARTPRYLPGIVTGNGRVDLLGGEELLHESAPGGAYVLVAWLPGNLDNWQKAGRSPDGRRYPDGGAYLRDLAEGQRRADLAGLASEERPDPDADRARILAPDEGFSVARAEEVAYIYGVKAETLRGWKRKHRAALAPKPPKGGRPRRGNR